MEFNISGFTHKGTGIYESNEDNMLVNGVQLNDGEISFYEQDKCICFVSDGVGGNSAGDFAAAFIVNKVKLCLPEEIHNLRQVLINANNELIELANSRTDLRGCACTLTGMIVTPDFFDIIHVGDTEIWLLRDEMLFKITKDEVLDPEDWRSPLTNYFGSTNNNLAIKSYENYPQPKEGDIFLICSDGLFKSIKTKTVKPILIGEDKIEEKIIKLKNECLTHGADDNVTAILIEVY